MRSSSRCKDKFYSNSWCISGEKLKLLENPRKCYSSKQIQIASAPEIQEKLLFDEQEFSKSNNKSFNRPILQLNHKDYKCDQVLNKQLRHIYETVEVEDFERILNKFYISSVYRQFPRRSDDDVLNTVDADKIYEEFFGRYYRFLEDIPNDS